MRVRSKRDAQNTEYQLPTPEEGGRALKILAQKIGSKAAGVYSDKSNQMIAKLQGPADAVEGIKDKILRELHVMRTEDPKLQMLNLRDELINVIASANLHFKDASKLQADRQAHMKETYQYILNVDEYYSKIQKLKESYQIYPDQDLITQIVELNNELQQIKVKVNELTKCPENQKKHAFCVDYYAKELEMFDHLLSLANLANQHANTNYQTMMAYKREVRGLIQQCEGDIDEFMKDPFVSNFVTKANMSLSYKKPQEQIQPLKPAIAPVQTGPRPTLVGGAGVTAQPVSQQLRTYGNSSPVMWQQPSASAPAQINSNVHAAPKRRI